MNVNLISGLPASLAGNPISQAKGTDSDRAIREASNKEREVKGAHKAEAASDVGETDDDVETNDRDADGRQLLERRYPQAEATEETAGPETNEPTTHNEVHPKDLSGEVGNALDLEG